MEFKQSANTFFHWQLAGGWQRKVWGRPAPAPPHGVPGGGGGAAHHHLAAEPRAGGRGVPRPAAQHQVSPQAARPPGSGHQRGGQPLLPPLAAAAGGGRHHHFIRQAHYDAKGRQEQNLRGIKKLQRIVKEEEIVSGKHVVMLLEFSASWKLMWMVTRSQKSYHIRSLTSLCLSTVTGLKNQTKPHSTGEAAQLQKTAQQYFLIKINFNVFQKLCRKKMAIEKFSWARCGSPATWSCRLCSVVQRKAKLCYVTNNRNYSWVVTILLLYIIALSENQVKYFEKYWRRRTILAAHITKMFLLKLRKQNKYSSLKAMDLVGVRYGTKVQPVQHSKGYGFALHPSPELCHPYSLTGAFPNITVVWMLCMNRLKYFFCQR